MLNTLPVASGQQMSTVSEQRIGRRRPGPRLALQNLAAVDKFAGGPHRNAQLIPFRMPEQHHGFAE